jgi:hypothetical protein
MSTAMPKAVANVTDGVTDRVTARGRARFSDISNCRKQLANPNDGAASQ